MALSGLQKGKGKQSIPTVASFKMSVCFQSASFVGLSEDNSHNIYGSPKIKEIS